MKSSVLALVGGASTALAAVKGFNYAAQEGNQAKFEADFKLAANLKGAKDMTSARLYTMIQEGTTNTPIEAIPAAIDTKTSLLLGMWASADQAHFDNELAALSQAIKQYGSKFTDLVVGISVGSEDLYRITPTGIENKENPGQSPDVLVDYIGQTRKAIKGGPLEKTLVGHVDTWNAFTNSSNFKVSEACDFLGLDEYPFFQTTDPNSIDNGGKLFFEAFDKVQATAPNKQIWVTEAGWPTSGKKSGAAVASVDNAETFWQDVFCELESRGVNTWWFTLQDAGASPSFGVSENGQPLYDLSCKPRPSSSSSAASSSSTSKGSSSASSSSSDASTTSSGGSDSSQGSQSNTTETAGSQGSGVAYATGSGSSSSGSAGLGSGAASATPSGSPEINAAGKIGGGVAALLVAAATLLLL